MELPRRSFSCHINILNETIETHYHHYTREIQHSDMALSLVIQEFRLDIAQNLTEDIQQAMLLGLMVMVAVVVLVIVVLAQGEIHLVVTLQTRRIVIDKGIQCAMM